MARIDAAIAERAREQLGLVTYQQLADLGCSRQMRRSRVADGVLIPAGHRVLRVTATPCSWEQAVLAVQLDAGRPATVSHMSAAALWEFNGLKPGAVELSTWGGRQPRATRGVVHRTSPIADDDVRMRGPFALTSPARTLVDIAGRLTAAQIEDVLDCAARDGLLDVPSVVAVLGRLGTRGRRGAGRLSEVLGLEALGQTDSWLEKELLRILDGHGLPLPRTQVELSRADGRVARVDAFFDRARLVVEVDGHRTHSTRRQRQADAEREAALVARGWRVVRFTYEDVTRRPGYVARTVALHLRQRLPA